MVDPVPSRAELEDLILGELADEVDEVFAEHASPGVVWGWIVNICFYNPR